MAESRKVKYLLIGGGAAAAQAAVGIREVDREGTILLVGKEKWWPYDRPPLSKTILSGETEPADSESKDPSWYEKNNVEVIRDVEAISLDRDTSTVGFSDDSEVEYERLLIATGATPKPLEIKGADLENVHLFRTVDDSLAVRDALHKCKSIVLVGAGYIGLEVAAQALGAGLSVALIDPNDRPWSKNTSEKTGEFLKSYFESKGATFLFRDEVVEIEGENRVEAVRTKSGARVPADLVVSGIGVTLNTKLAEAGGLEVDEKNGIVVDENLRTSDSKIFVAGDVAAFQDVNLRTRWHAEHYMNARWQGNRAGKNMAGSLEKYDRVPYFFSDMGSLHMVLRGDPQAGKTTTVLGSIEAADYIELYAREDGTLAMGIAFSEDEKKLEPIADKLESLFKERAKIDDISLETFSV